jgi:hypothetical protein
MRSFKEKEHGFCEGEDDVAWEGLNWNMVDFVKKKTWWFLMRMSMEDFVKK